MRVPIAHVVLDIIFPFDPNTQRAKRVDDKMTAHMLLHINVGQGTYEKGFTKVEQLLGVRMKDTIYSQPGEDFSTFGNRLRDDAVEKLRPISVSRITSTKLINGKLPETYAKDMWECRFEITFDMRAE